MSSSALGADLGEEWERLDRWALFTEDFQIVVNAMHRLANAGAVALDDLKPERFVVRTYCECTPMVLEFLRAHDIDVERRHEVGAEGDLLALLEAGVGVALVPRSTKAPDICFASWWTRSSSSARSTSMASPADSARPSPPP